MSLEISSLSSKSETSIGFDQTEEEILTFKVSGEALESAAGTESEKAEITRAYGALG